MSTSNNPFEQPRRFTLKELDAALDEVDLPPKAMARAQRIGDKYRSQVRQTMVDRNQADVTRIEEAAARLREFVKELTQRGDAIRDDLDAGRLTASQARDRIKPIGPALDSARRELASLKQAEADSWERVNRDAADHQEEILQRFPSVHEALPLIKPEHVSGSADFDLP